MATETFPFAVTFSNGQFEIAEPTNNNVVTVFPESQAVMKTHISAANLYFFGTAGNLITLDYTLCTNLTTASRQLQIEAIVALAAGSPIGSVTISGQPIGVNVQNTPAVTISGTPNVAVTNTPAVTISGTPNVAVTNTPTVNLAAGSALAVNLNRTSFYSFLANGTTSGNMNLVLKVNGAGSIRLLTVSGCAVIAGQNAVALYLNPTVTTTYNTPAPLTGSIVQANTSANLTFTNGTLMLYVPFNLSFSLNLSEFNMLFPQTTLIGCELIMGTSVGNSIVTALSWTE